MRALLELTRPLNCLIAAAGAATGMLMAGLVADIRVEAWAAPVSAMLVAAFGNVLNDLRDAAVDRVAHPGRPIPSGRVKPRLANLLAGWLLGMAMAAAWVAGGVATLLVAGATCGLLVAYEARLKARGLAGNVVVALATALTFPFGWLAVTGSWPNVPREPLAAVYDLEAAVVAIAVMAFGANLARELAKDAEDVLGDAGHRRTLPMHHPRVAGAIAAAAAGVGVLASVGLAPLFFTAVAANDGPALGAPALVVAAVAVLAADVLVVAGGTTATSRPRLAKRLLKAGMLLALAGALWPVLALR